MASGVFEKLGILKHFADRGMIAIASEYRVKNDHNVSPVECIQDARSTIQWVRDNSHMLGIDPNSVVALGFICRRSPRCLHRNHR